jgi:hypothetical protein
LKKPFTKVRAGGVAQSESSAFKPQHRKKKKKNAPESDEDLAPILRHLQTSMVYEATLVSIEPFPYCRATSNLTQERHGQGALEESWVLKNSFMGLEK